MFSVNQQAINGQSLYSVVIGSTEEQAQHSHSEKRYQSDQILHIQKYSPFFPFFLKYNSAEHF